MPLRPGGSGTVASWSVHNGCDGSTSATFVANDSVNVDALLELGTYHFPYKVTILVAGG